MRVSQTVGGQTSWYVYDRMSGLPLLIDDGTQGYVHAGGVISQADSQGTTDWLLADALGSVRGVADGSGALAGATDYAAFGSPRAQTGSSSSFGFTGEQTDASTGNIYLRSRYHNPSAGRFLSADTVQPNAPGTQGYHRYSYTANNPATFIDPSGHSLWTGAGGTAGGGGSINYWPDVVNTFISTVLIGFQRLIAAFVASTAPAPALANGSGQGMALLTTTEINTVLAPAYAFVALLVAGAAIESVGHLSAGTGSGVAAPAIAIGKMFQIGAFVLFFTLGILLTLIVDWNFYPDTQAPSRFIDWTVENVGTAVFTWPPPPGRQPCTVSGVAIEVAQSIVFTAVLSAYMGANFVYSTTDLLLDVGTACFSSGNSSNGDTLPLTRFWKPKVFNGKRVYQRDDFIDPNLTDATGLTNLERMKNGWAPIGFDGRRIELHHLTQTDESAVVELTWSIHTVFYDMLHIERRGPNAPPSQINRDTFRVWRESYWKQRACDFGGC